MNLDKITLDRINILHPKVRDEALTIYKDIVKVLTGRAFCRFAYTHRSFAEQAALYAQGRTKLYDSNGRKLGIVTKAKPGSSFHNYGLAIDIVLIADKDGNGSYESAVWDTVTDFDCDGKSDWMECIALFKVKGWDWGGDWKSFKDLPHVEKTFGYTWQELLDLYNKKYVDKDGFVKI